MIYEIDLERKTNNIKHHCRSILCLDYKCIYANKCILVKYKKVKSDKWHNASSSLFYRYIIREATTGKIIETVN